MRIFKKKAITRYSLSISYRQDCSMPQKLRYKTKHFKSSYTTPAKCTQNALFILCKTIGNDEQICRICAFSPRALPIYLYISPVVQVYSCTYARERDGFSNYNNNNDVRTLIMDDERIITINLKVRRRQFVGE